MESALDKFQFIEISHLLSPKTNPKKPGAQPSDKPKAALSLCFEMEQRGCIKTPLKNKGKEDESSSQRPLFVV